MWDSLYTQWYESDKDGGRVYIIYNSDGARIMKKIIILGEHQNNEILDS